MKTKTKPIKFHSSRRTSLTSTMALSYRIIRRDYTHVKTSSKDVDERKKPAKERKTFFLEEKGDKNEKSIENVLLGKENITPLLTRYWYR